VLCEWRAIARKGLASLYERRDNLAAHEKQLEDLYAEIGRLTTQLNWLKKSYQPESSGTAGADRA
jgi:putative transposase